MFVANSEMVEGGGPWNALSLEIWNARWIWVVVGAFNLLEQSWVIPYSLGFDDNKIFKEELDKLMCVQVCKYKYQYID